MFPRNTQVGPDFDDRRKRAATPVRSAVFGEKAIDFVLVYNVENGIVPANENQTHEEKSALKKKAQLRKKSRAIYVENLRRSGLIVEKVIAYLLLAPKKLTYKYENNFFYKFRIPYLR